MALESAQWTLRNLNDLYERAAVSFSDVNR